MAGESVRRSVIAEEAVELQARPHRDEPGLSGCVDQKQATSQPRVSTIAASTRATASSTVSASPRMAVTECWSSVRCSARRRSVISSTTEPTPIASPSGASTG